jgi:hypothetical protein
MLVLCGVIFWLQHQALRRCRMYLDLNHTSILPHICKPDYLPSFSPTTCFACARRQVSWTTCRLRSMRSCHVQREALTGAYSNVNHACRHVIWKQIREDTRGRSQLGSATAQVTTIATDGVLPTLYLSHMPTVTCRLLSRIHGSFFDLPITRVQHAITHGYGDQPATFAIFKQYDPVAG